jgi:hypothetical protein
MITSTEQIDFCVLLLLDYDVCLFFVLPRLITLKSWIKAVSMKHHHTVHQSEGINNYVEQQFFFV